MDFEQLVSQNEAERRQREERELRQRTILQQRIQEVKQEMVELRRDIDGCLTEVEACFNLLLPRFELPDIYFSNDAASQDISDCQDTNQDTINQDTINRDGTIGQDTVDQDRTKTKSILAENFKPAPRRLSSQGSFVSLGEGTDSESEGASDCEGASEIPPHVDGQDRGVGGHVSTEMEPGGGGGGGGGCAVMESEELVLSSESSDSDSEVEWEDVESAGVDLWDADMQEHGMTAHSFSVPVQLSRQVEVRETDDNSSILCTLRERRQVLVNHHLPNLSKCLEVRKQKRRSLC